MEAISQPIFDAAGYQEVTTPEIRREAIRAHGAIMKALEQRDAKLAFSRMEKHVSAYAAIARRMLVESDPATGSAVE
jgi:DNA-binding FadR family transcriptional regulator